jgi:6-phosphogluconolactonase (cycloisomerase 2 family)
LQKENLMNTRLVYCLLGAAACVGFFSCTKNPGGGVTGAAEGKIVYVLSNDYHDNANAILAYRHKDDGTMVPLQGSPFLTRGAGVANPKQALGPDDTDDPMIISPDGQYLLAVNGGSNTVAVFAIGRDGGLSPVAGSPFASGGQTPCSIAINGSFAYVTNKSLDPLHTITQLPNYVSFTIDGAGRLEQVAGSKVEVPAGSSPSQVLVSNDHRFLFGADFLGFMLTSGENNQPLGTLVSFGLQGSGKLNWAPGAPYVLPTGNGGALGLAVNPIHPTVYVGFPVSSSIGSYSVDESTGALTFQSVVSSGAAACWLRTDWEGRYLYVLNSGENSVGVFSIADPNSPVLITKLVMKDPGTTYTTSSGGTAISDAVFAMNFSPDGTILYVISQNSNPDFTVPNYSYLHALKVARDGTLSEPTDGFALPTATDVRPLGVVTR